MCLRCQRTFSVRNKSSYLQKCRFITFFLYNMFYLLNIYTVTQSCNPNLYTIQYEIRYVFVLCLHFMQTFKRYNICLPDIQYYYYYISINVYFKAFRKMLQPCILTSFTNELQSKDLVLTLNKYSIYNKMNSLYVNKLYIFFFI